MEAPEGPTVDPAVQSIIDSAYASAPIGTMPDGRPVQVRPCKYYPNCAKMDDPEHNAMYSHNSVVKKPPRTPLVPGIAGAAGLASRAAPTSLQLCGFGEHCKRCGDEDHLDKYIHSCKFGARCKKIDDPIHLKRFIHVLPGAMPPLPPMPMSRGPRHAPLAASYTAAAAQLAAAAYPYAAPYGYPYGLPPLASSYAPFASSSHHSRASAASYHPYGGGGDRGSSYSSRDLDRAKDDWATMAATIAGGFPAAAAAAAYAAGDLRGAADGYGSGYYGGLPGDAPYGL